MATSFARCSLGRVSLPNCSKFRRHLNSPEALCSKNISSVQVPTPAISTCTANVPKRFLATKSSFAYTEMAQASELARIKPSELEASHIHEAVTLLNDLPKLMLPRAQSDAVDHMLLRVLLSYQYWQLPTPVAPEDQQNGASAQWDVGVRARGEGSDGAVLLPLASDTMAFERLTTLQGGIGLAAKSVLSGAHAVAQHFLVDGVGRTQGLLLVAGQMGQLVLGKDRLPQLHQWQATLRLEALMASELSDPFLQAPASHELSELLAGKAKMCFVRMGNDLARDGSPANNVIVLTSCDAAALCANAYGQQQVRELTPQELLGCADGAGSDFGFCLTLGPDRKPYTSEPAEETHIPMWHTRTVTSAWLASALRRGGTETNTLQA
eukprot:gnl/TRDRNA2_/TRDRNA2_129393_c1_seq1.p1 gnl/TRDRNA2_/TRDRNA2_129393_c1~~gnl/TRDRNA2_/TRDRNA2_129393_c1_seq1.p1  ORF type:complete len:381 (-),score=58.32 gnl/TRDRNA2_/TRDRNA2_129393_c1_seq1:135-1277(-)